MKEVFQFIFLNTLIEKSIILSWKYFFFMISQFEKSFLGRYPIQKWISNYNWVQKYQDGKAFSLIAWRLNKKVKLDYLVRNYSLDNGCFKNNFQISVPMLSNGQLLVLQLRQICSLRLLCSYSIICIETLKIVKPIQWRIFSEWRK